MSEPQLTWMTFLTLTWSMFAFYLLFLMCFKVVVILIDNIYLFIYLFIYFFLDGKTIVPTLFSHLNQMVAGGDWRQKYAAMQVITTCCEGCRVALKQHISDLIV